MAGKNKKISGTKDWIGGKTSVYKIISASNHAVDGEREVDDYYATDPIAIDKLLGAVALPQSCWECACGAGHLSERLIKYWKEVVSTDLKDRGYKNGHSGIDFLRVEAVPWEFNPCAIVTNPPYKYAKEFVYHALKLLKDGDMCCMFLKLTFLEGKARRVLFKEYPPEKVLVFSERIVCAPNGEFEKVKSSAVAYAWFVWVKGFAGKPIIEWI